MVNPAQHYMTRETNINPDFKTLGARPQSDLIMNVGFLSNGLITPGSK